MKNKLFFVITCIILVVTSNVSAQSTDISVFAINRHYNHTNTNLMWFTHSDSAYFVEARANFDWDNTLALYLGKTFGNDVFWITPEIGALVGDYNGFGPELLMGGKYKSLKYFLFNQYTLNVNDLPDFLYQYTEVGLVASRYVMIGCAGQVYYEPTTPRADAFIDAGPFVKFSYRSLYLKPWCTWDPGHEQIKKVIIGLGYTF